MGNFSIHAGLVDGSLMPIISEESTSDEIVAMFTGDDTGAPPRSLTIEVVTENGSRVQIYIPNSSAVASVTVDGRKI